MVGRKVNLLFITFVGLEIADTLLTLVLNRTGVGGDLNPVVRILLNSTMGFVIFKLVVVALLGSAIVYCNKVIKTEKDRLSARGILLFGLLLLVIIYLLVVVNNLYWIIRIH